MYMCITVFRLSHNEHSHRVHDNRNAARKPLPTSGTFPRGQHLFGLTNPLWRVAAAASARAAILVCARACRVQSSSVFFSPPFHSILFTYYVPHHHPPPPSTHRQALTLSPLHIAPRLRRSYIHISMFSHRTGSELVLRCVCACVRAYVSASA